MQVKYTVADVLNLEQVHLPKLCASTWQLRTLYAIKKCRTAALGGHIDRCEKCNKMHLFYHSCRNRHCPICQGHKVVQWVRAREKELLPVGYFHVVFTLPREVNIVALQHPRKVYAALFKAAWQTLNQFATNPKHLGAKLGMIAVLHTWGQNLSLHPHLHCIVPGGGVSEAGFWRNAKSKGKYLFNVKAMSRVYRAKYVAELRKALPELREPFYDSLFKQQWVVYAKRPFLTPQFVIEYLGRYTHKIAISNYRIRHIDYKNRTVTFSLKNYRKNGAKALLTLSAGEFVRRFAMHVLPKGFTRIRHFGILSSSWKKEKLPALQQKLEAKTKVLVKAKTQEPEQTQLRKCPACKTGVLLTLVVFDNRGPPPKYKKLLMNIETKK